MNKTIPIIVIALVVIIGGYFLFSGEYQAPQESGTQTPSLEVPAPGQESVPEMIVSPDGQDELSAREINMVSGNLFFNPSNLTFTKDKPVMITFQNIGSHTFTIDELGVNVTLRGNSATIEFTPNQSGTFEYYCAVPGHREGGMFGSLLVE